MVRIPFSRRNAMGEGARRADEGLSPRVPMLKQTLIRPAGHLLPSSGREKGLVVRIPFSRRIAMGATMFRSWACWLPVCVSGDDGIGEDNELSHGGDEG